MPVASVDPPALVACSLLRERLTGNYACDSADKKNVICDEEPFLLGLDDECARLMKVTTKRSQGVSVRPSHTSFSEMG